ncbi:FxDxF family PEP-CTERM protein [Duganella sp. BuS-21]|uniref:FxDxF family PEP-CTERM protein n=1 Tax=Duganella sp. BuS-21 TaxID=2943848 RepID=UPI0035A5CE53
MKNKKLHLQTLAMAVMLAASSLAAAAAPQGPGAVTLTNTTGNLWTASLGNTPVLGLFTDVFTFTNPVTPGSIAYGTQVNTSFMGWSNVTFLNADLNGIPLLTGAIPAGLLTFNVATLLPSSVSGPLVLTIHGNSNGGSYGGDINVLMAPVPEPVTYGMMIAGLGILAMFARRRKE